MKAFSEKREPASRRRVEISDVKIRFVENGTGGLRGWMSCVIFGAMKLDNIAIRSSRDGSLYLTYPAKRTSAGDTYQYFHPISVEASQAVQDAVLARLSTLAKAAAEGGVEG